MDGKIKMSPTRIVPKMSDLRRKIMSGIHILFIGGVWLDETKWKDGDCIYEFTLQR